jgi:hypothetical protein
LHFTAAGSVRLNADYISIARQQGTIELVNAIDQWQLQPLKQIQINEHYLTVE